MARATKVEKYRDLLDPENVKDVVWRFGAPPNYDVVDKLVKTWEMEMFHKTRPEDFKTVDTQKFTLSVNGRQGLTMGDIKRIKGGYNAMLQTQLPEHYRVYNPAEESADSSHVVFTTAFPRGFALEILHVYAGPPVIVYKFRHWGFVEGPFKGHAPTGEKAEFQGIGIFELDENSKIFKVELFHDRGELLGGLVKGEKTTDSTGGMASSCPVMRTG
ncbi:pathogen-related protein isoform X2 [Daucus carota subsp. sativus]|uniref:pathogen-related protein isoform X2 n=1 Tax=Daucus carota subsp. sativus TaxID=79200 RepID=UPI0030832BEC